MVEHEVSVETTQVETDTVRFCDYCGDPEEVCESIETLFTASHGPQIIRESRNAQSNVIAWQPGRNPDRRESLNVTGRTGERLYVEYDVDGLAEACEGCRERLGEGEIPNPGTVHRDRVDPADLPDDVGQPAYGDDSDDAEWWKLCASALAFVGLAAGPIAMGTAPEVGFVLFLVCGSYLIWRLLGAQEARIP